MAKNISRSKRKTRSLKRTHLQNNKEEVVEIHAKSVRNDDTSSLVYSYPLASIRKDLVKSLILFAAFITIVVALSTTKWF